MVLAISHVPGVLARPVVVAELWLPVCGGRGGLPAHWHVSCPDTAARHTGQIREHGSVSRHGRTRSCRDMAARVSCLALTDR